MNMAELIIASKNGYFSKVIELLQSGFSVKVRDRDNATALYWGACRGYSRICAVLVKAGSDINARVKWGSTALHACSDRGHKDCVQTLLSFGADLNIQNVRGDTPLHLAGYRGYADIVIILLGVKANITLLNEKKKTAEQEARGQGHIRVANILQSHREGNCYSVDWDVSDFRDTSGSADYNMYPDTVTTTNVKAVQGVGFPKPRMNIQWNELSQDSKVTESSLQGLQQRRESNELTIQREAGEPQESEEPCSASSWGSCSKVHNTSLTSENFTRVNNNGQCSYSDTVAEKRVKRPMSVIPYITEDPIYPAATNVGRPGDLTKHQPSYLLNNGQSSATNNVLSHEDKKSNLTNFQVDPTVPKTVKLRPGQSKFNTDTLESQVLRRRLEEVSRYAENLQLKLVTSNEKIGDLEISNDEKLSLLKQHETLQQKSDQKVSVLTRMVEENEPLRLSLANERSLTAELQGRNEALSAEVVRLRLELKSLCNSPKNPIPTSQLVPPAAENKESSPKHCPPIGEPPRPLTERDSDGHSVLVNPADMRPSQSSEADTSTDATYHKVLHVLKLCIGENILSDHQLYSLNQRYRRLLQAGYSNERVQQQRLDRSNREWRPGVDYILLDEKPVNQREGGPREGSCSLIFRIGHKQQPYILKMMINLIDLVSSGHGNGQSLPKFLSRNFSAEYEIPLSLPPHSNIIQIRHFYEGSTECFRRHLYLIVPASLDVPLDMAHRTMFMVMPQYPLTLKAFMLEQRTKHPEPPFNIMDRFLLLWLYQILSAVDHLGRNSVVHRDIKADNVFIDHKLRPIIGDFGFARRFQEANGEKLMFTESGQVMAGNSNAWAPELARLNRDGPSSLPAEASLEEVYQKADAYAVSRMFYSLLRPLVDADDFPLSSIAVPHYDEAAIPQLPPSLSLGLTYILRQLVLDSPLDRPTTKEAMVLVGMILFGPRPGEVNTAAEFMAFYQAKLIQHLTVPILERLDDFGRVLSLDESIKQNSSVLEVHMLTHATPQEMWDSCKVIRQYSLNL